MVYIFGFKISNFAKLASNCLEKNLRAVSCGRIYVTNIKILYIYLFINIFINISINTTIYTINIVDLSGIKYSSAISISPTLTLLKMALQRSF